MRLTNLLRGEKVYLDAWTKDDVPTVTRWYANTEFSRLLDTSPARARTQKYPEEWMDEADKSDRMYSFAIRTCADDKLIGLVELEGIIWQHGSGWIGIGIGEPEYWGGGYGREAMELLLRFAFWEINLHRVQLSVFAYNVRAIALYEKLGFVREGVQREFVHRDGERHDMILYGLLRREWEGSRQSPVSSDQ